MSWAHAGTLEPKPSASQGGTHLLWAWLWAQVLEVMDFVLALLSIILLSSLNKVFSPLCLSFLVCCREGDNTHLIGLLNEIK